MEKTKAEREASIAGGGVTILIGVPRKALSYLSKNMKKGNWYALLIDI